MSEYQYYEFQAIDRPLTEAQVRELRSCSTRAHITPTSFVNHYEWGNFKGDAQAWMEKYFDAFLYLANWGTHELMLRLPCRLLDPDMVRPYCGGDSTSVREIAGYLILSFSSEDEDMEDWVEGAGFLASIISVRAELLRGDLRPLYLGWLLAAQAGELDDENLEPPVPPGLDELSAAQESMAEFLHIDYDLLTVATLTSPPLEDTALDRKEVTAWMAKLPAKEKDEVLTRLVVDGEQTLVSELLQRFLKERSGVTPAVSSPRRTVGELLQAAETRRVERQRTEAEKRAKEKARRERDAVIAREKYLDKMAGRESRLWDEVEALVSTKQPKSYDQAVRLLVDLRDLEARAKQGAFQRRLEELRQTHARKPSFIERLQKAKL